MRLRDRAACSVLALYWLLLGIVIIAVIVYGASGKLIRGMRNPSPAVVSPVCVLENVTVAETTKNIKGALARVEVLKLLLGEVMSSNLRGLCQPGQDHRVTPDRTFGQLRQFVWIESRWAEPLNTYRTSQMESGTFATVLNDSRHPKVTVWGNNGVGHSLRSQATNTDPRSFFDLHRFNGLLGCFLGVTRLYESDRGIDEDQSGSNLGPKNYLFVVGCIALLCGFVLLSKVLDKVYLDPRFNVNMAVGGFFLAAFVVWIGGGIMLWVFGLV